MIGRNTFWALVALLAVAYMAAATAFAQSPEQPLAVPATVVDADADADADGDDWTTDDGDCDDNNPAISPKAIEVCRDNIDNDCNGTVDEPGVCGGSVMIAYNPDNACDEAGFKDIMSEIPAPVVMALPGHWELTGGFSTEFRSYSQCPTDRQLNLAAVRSADAFARLTDVGWSNIQVTGPAPGIAGVILR
ncbi:hypothetical protein COV03_03005, partial [Candidatus Uhrbacteria bacterium CG10_big_fil_rev_8_21_14_0_10_41_26]